MCTYQYAASKIIPICWNPHKAVAIELSAFTHSLRAIEGN